MPTVNDEFLLHLLRICAALAPQPLYPARYARETHLDRAQLDEGLDELRRRGLVKLTEWVKDFGQGCALTEAGQQALASGRVAAVAAAAAPSRAKDADETSSYARGESVRAAFIESRPSYMSRILLILNVLYFAYGAFLANGVGDLPAYLEGSGRTTGEILYGLGALYPDWFFRAGHPPQVQRIVLFFFLHFGFLHLFMNMYFLGSLGPLIERMWGAARYLTIYFIAGIVSGCVILLLAFLQPENSALTVGASGPLYGLFAALMVWFYLNKQHLPPMFIQEFSRNIGINLLILTAINFFPNVSWQGHLGGAIGGLLAALLLHVQRFNPRPAVRILALLGVPVVPVAFLALVFWLRP